VHAEQEGAEHERECQIASSSKDTIDINRRRIGSLVRDVNLEIFEKMSNNHLIGKIPTWNQKVLKYHEVNEELQDINSNVF